MEFIRIRYLDGLNLNFLKWISKNFHYFFIIFLKLNNQSSQQLHQAVILKWF